MRATPLGPEVTRVSLPQVATLPSTVSFTAGETGSVSVERVCDSVLPPSNTDRHVGLLSVNTGSESVPVSVRHVESPSVGSQGEKRGGETGGGVSVLFDSLDKGYYNMQSTARAMDGDNNTVKVSGHPLKVRMIDCSYRLHT